MGVLHTNKRRYADWRICTCASRAPITIFASFSADPDIRLFKKEAQLFYRFAVPVSFTFSRTDKEMSLSKLLAKSPCKLGTHDGIFHADEIMGLALIKKLFEINGKSPSDLLVLRTRNQEQLDECDIVIDVGGEYDPSRARFDHHQREFHKTYSDERDQRLSSAGLVFLHYGDHLFTDDCIPGMKKMTSPDGDSFILMSDSNIKLPVSVIKQYLYDRLFAEIDAADHGAKAVSTDPNSTITFNTTLSQTIAMFNSTMSFDAALNYCSMTLNHHLTYSFTTWVQNYLQLYTHLQLNHKLHKANKVPWLTLSLSAYFDFQYAFFRMGRDADFKNVRAIVYPKSGSHDIQEEADPVNTGPYHVQLVPKSFTDKTLRYNVPPEWLGRRGEDAANATGIKGVQFVHQSGFLIVCESRDVAYEVATKLHLYLVMKGVS